MPSQIKETLARDVYGIGSHAHRRYVHVQLILVGPGVLDLSHQTTGVTLTAVKPSRAEVIQICHYLRYYDTIFSNELTFMQIYANWPRSILLKGKTAYAKSVFKQYEKISLKHMDI